ncbi:hypothetical protein R84B8_03135 [Treponema sp. R8-4-B8]
MKTTDKTKALKLQNILAIALAAVIWFALVACAETNDTTTDTTPKEEPSPLNDETLRLAYNDGVTKFSYNWNNGTLSKTKSDLLADRWAEYGDGMTHTDLAGFKSTMTLHAPKITNAFNEWSQYMASDSKEKTLASGISGYEGMVKGTVSELKTEYAVYNQIRGSGGNIGGDRLVNFFFDNEAQKSLFSKQMEAYRIAVYTNSQTKSDKKSGYNGAARLEGLREDIYNGGGEVFSPDVIQAQQDLAETLGRFVPACLLMQFEDIEQFAALMGISYIEDKNIILPTSVTKLTFNTWANGNIDAGGGKQWFSFKATASSQYIHLRPVSPYPYGATYYVTLYDNNTSINGKLLFQTGDYFISPVPVTKDSVYYIMVNTSSTSSGNATYKIGFNESYTEPVNATGN